MLHSSTSANRCAASTWQQFGSFFSGVRSSAAFFSGVRSSARSLVVCAAWLRSLVMCAQGSGSALGRVAVGSRLAYLSRGAACAHSRGARCRRSECRLDGGVHSRQSPCA